nr:unnamed protein product [Callosobruchus analis]
MVVKLSDGFVETFAFFYNFCNVCGVPTVIIKNGRISVKKYAKMILSSGDVSQVVALLSYFVSTSCMVTFILMNIFFHTSRSELILDVAVLHRDLENFCRKYRKLSFRNVILGAVCAGSLKIIFQNAVAVYSLQSLVKVHLRCLNPKLRYILKHESALTLSADSYSKIIYQTRAILKRVTKVTEGFNKFFGITNLGQIFLIFPNITIRLYNYFKLNSRSFSLYYAIINSVFKCVCLCTLADDFTEQAKAAGRVICKINTYEIRLLREIEAFSLQAISYEYKIIAGGFLTVNNGLLVEVIIIT